MPRGEKTIDWTSDNDARLLLTIIAVENVRPNHEQIAAVFGRGVNASAIASRLKKLRAKAKDFGSVAADSFGGKPKTTKRAPTARTMTKKGRIGMLLSDNDESADMEDEDEDGQELTPPATDSADNGNAAAKTPPTRQKTIGGRVTKARTSPRKTMKKDYKALEDPFIAMEGTIDAGGEEVFEHEKSDSEDTLTNDQEYMKEAQAATIKMEEAI